MPRARGRLAGRQLELVGCVELKLDQPSPARDLYISARYLERSVTTRSGRDSRFVLSAEYGLFAPDRVICAYNLQNKRSQLG